MLSREEGAPTLAFKPVAAEIVTEDITLLQLVLRHSTGREETIQTTDEHPFFVPCKGWVRADVVQPGDEVRTVGGSAIILAQRFGSTRTTVYNLTVDGHHTYHVGPDGVLVHNCKIFATEQVPRHLIHRRPANRGDAPWGADGNRVELHHPDPDQPYLVQEKLQAGHRGVGQQGVNHPDPWPGMSPANRALYKADKRNYWALQWDLGRFDGLPE